MRTLLFVMLPTTSHYMTSFPLAKEFEKKGFKVVFTGNSSSLETLVKQNGLAYETMHYQTTEGVPNIKYFLSLFMISLLSKSFLFERYREFYLNIMEVKRLIKEVQADTIFIDEHLSHYYFYFKAQRSKIFFINTKLQTSRNGNNTPLNSAHLPNSSFISKILNEFLWFIVSSKHFLKSLKCKLAFIGKDDIFFAKRFCKNHRIDYEAFICSKNVFYYGIKHVKRIILAPEYLDLPTNNSYNIYAFLEDKRNEDNFFNEGYADLKKLIGDKKYQKTILCSFGTLVNESDKILFLNELNEAVKGEDILTIIVSRNLDIINNRHGNVHIYPSVPQLDLLKYCDLMIHHGGFNTIKECMQFQVPMLIYALKKEGYDWLGNAARVKWRGLGVVGNIYKDNPEKIKENIKKALLIEMPKQNYEQEYNKVNKFIEEEL